MESARTVIELAFGGAGEIDEDLGGIEEEEEEDDEDDEEEEREPFDDGRGVKGSESGPLDAGLEGKKATKDDNSARNFSSTERSGLERTGKEGEAGGEVEGEDPRRDNVAGARGEGREECSSGGLVSCFKNHLWQYDAVRCIGNLRKKYAVSSVTDPKTRLESNFLLGNMKSYHGHKIRNTNRKRFHTPNTDFQRSI